MKTYIGQYELHLGQGVWSGYKFVSVEAENEYQAEEKVREWIDEEFGIQKINHVHIQIFTRIE